MTKRVGPFPRMGTIFTVHATNETGTCPTRTGKRTRLNMPTTLVLRASKYITKSRACYPVDCVSHFTKGSFRDGSEVSEG